jgi:hypothetical protein
VIRPMTIRDQMAAHALTAIVVKMPFVRMSDPHNILGAAPRVSKQAGAEIRRAVARSAYAYADAMLAERKGKRK